MALDPRLSINIAGCISNFSISDLEHLVVRTEYCRNDHLVPFFAFNFSKNSYTRSDQMNKSANTSR